MSHVVHHQVCMCVWVYAKKCILDISLSFFFFFKKFSFFGWGVYYYYYYYYYYLFWLCWVFTSHGTQVPCGT